MKQTTAILLNLSLPILATLFALGIVELGVRIFYPSPGKSATSSNWSDRPSFYFKDPAAQTMQDYRYPDPKQASDFRIAAIGDSFTFAPFMQFTDTYVKRLETMLNLSKSGKGKLEFINYGVPAYSTSHEVAVTERALKAGADIILLQITLNDPEIKHHTPAGLRENMEDRFGPLKLTGWIGRAANRWRTLHLILTRLHNSKTHRAYIDYFQGLYNDPHTWNPFVQSVKNLVKLPRDANKPIVAVVFPLFGLPMDKSYPFYEIHSKVIDLLNSLKVPNIDLSEIYRGIPLERLQVIPGGDRHPNEIAHRMAAEAIYLWLERLNIIPEHFLIKERFATRLGIDRQRAWRAE
jgi:hypothetical protein